MFMVGGYSREAGLNFFLFSQAERLKAPTTTSGTKEEDDDEEVEAKDIILPTNYTNTAPSSIKEASRKDDFGLPPQGFFVVKCLGKNKIIVGGKTVSKGQVAILTDKVTLQLASYKLYFLLPLHNDENDQNPSILEIPNPEYEAYISATLKAKTVRKRSIEPYSGTNAAVHEEDELSVEELMQKMSDAIKVNQWDRRQQMLGTTIAHHAVLDAARSTECQKIAKKMNGTVSRYVVAHSLSPCSFPSIYVYFSRFASQLFVLEYTVPFLKYILYYGSRSEIMKWIKNSPKYYNWVSEMQSRMEFKSYQSSIGKALNRAGFERTGTTGRHVRWILPSDIYLDTSEPDIDANNGSEEKGESDDPESESGSIHVDSNQHGEVSHNVEQDFESQNNSFDVDHGDEDEEMLSQEIYDD
jgi:hypothetical protein